jgi:ABC-type antimicrobial peptide transport system permease subunit
MKIPIIYNLRSLKNRPASTITTALGMALVVAVFVAMMALANGFRAALVSTGSTDNVIVLRKGSNDELSSGLSRETANIIGAMPFVAKNSDGVALSSPETFVVISLNRVDGGLANVVARGVSPQATEVRGGIELIEGRWFRPGSAEVVIGKNLTGRFPNVQIGDVMSFGSRDWDVVGHFEASGSAFESEVWGENEQFMPVFRGQGFQSLTFRMLDPSAFEGIKETLENDPRLAVGAQREFAFYTNQSALLSNLLGFFAVFVAGVMAIGAVFGAINTMYAAVSSRAPEIGVLLTLGFKPRSVLGSFMLEALIIALIGGALGGLMALPVNGLVTSTTNWSSFSEVAFAFRVTPTLLVAGLIFAAVMGTVGGFFPALRAARMQVAQALREG